MIGKTITRLNNRLNELPLKTRTTLIYIFYAPIPLILVPAMLVKSGKLVDSKIAMKRLMPRPLNYLIAVPLAITGLFLVVWSWVIMVRIGKGHPFSQPDFEMQPSPSTLVTEGPFKLCRNPQSLGGFMMLYSLALAYNSPGMAFAAIPAAFSSWNLLVTRSEEPGMTKKFGDEYVRYMEEVPRYIPCLGRSSS